MTKNGFLPALAQFLEVRMDSLLLCRAWQRKNGNECPPLLTQWCPGPMTRCKLAPWMCLHSCKYSLQNDALVAGHHEEMEDSRLIFQSLNSIPAVLAGKSPTRTLSKNLLSITFRRGGGYSDSDTVCLVPPPLTKPLSRRRTSVPALFTRASQ